MPNLFCHYWSLNLSENDLAAALAAAGVLWASHPDDTEERSWLKQEFVKRGIVANEQVLDVTVPDVNFGNINLETLVKDDAAARTFIEQNRKLMRIPNGAASSRRRLDEEVRAELGFALRPFCEIDTCPTPSR